jgi:hypothetical protein
MPEPDEIAAETIGDLRAALEQVEELQADLASPSTLVAAT